MTSYLDQLTEHQRANALGIIAAVKARAWPAKAAVIAVETALTEAGMRIIASANVPASQRYPHDLLSWTSDGMGHDHASMGMFQQQTGYRWTPAGYGYAMNQTTMNSADGWGTPAELMNAQTSTSKFLNALARIDWLHKSNWVAAQDVQHSAYDGNPRQANNYSREYGGNYHSQDTRAAAIVAALWPTTHTFEEDEMLIVRDSGIDGKHGWPVLITGATHTVITDHSSAQALVAVGAKQVTLPHADYIRIRKGAVK